jgi:hypothetical protein
VPRLIFFITGDLVILDAHDNLDDFLLVGQCSTEIYVNHQFLKH